MYGLMCSCVGQKDFMTCTLNPRSVLQVYQHVYLALLYGLLAIKSVLVDDFMAVQEVRLR